jgi:hypothetical protein
LTIYFHGSISLREIEEALHSRGMHLREDGRGRLLADRVPRFLARAADAIAGRPVAPPAMRLVGGQETPVAPRDAKISADTIVEWIRRHAQGNT